MKTLLFLLMLQVTPDSHQKLCHKNFLQFWRLSTGAGKGDWHLLNTEDKRFLKGVQECATEGSCLETKVEYFSLEGELPK